MKLNKICILLVLVGLSLQHFEEGMHHKKNEIPKKKKLELKKLNRKRLKIKKSKNRKQRIKLALQRKKILARLDKLDNILKAREEKLEKKIINNIKEAKSLNKEINKNKKYSNRLSLNSIQMMRKLGIRKIRNLNNKISRYLRAFKSRRNSARTKIRLRKAILLLNRNKKNIIDKIRQSERSIRRASSFQSKHRFERIKNLRNILRRRNRGRRYFNNSNPLRKSFFRRLFL